MVRGRGGRWGQRGGLAGGRGFWRSAPAPAAMRPTGTTLWLRLALSLGLALVCPASVGLVSARAPIYVSSWAVRVSEGYREAERLARRFGFVNLGLVGGTRMEWRGRDWATQNTRPRQMTDGKVSLRSPRFEELPTNPYFSFKDPQRAHGAHTRASGWGRMQTRGILQGIREAGS